MSLCNETVSIDICNINYEVEVEFNYQPEERATKDYPGASEEIEIETVIISGIDITVLVSKEVLKAIEYELSKRN